MWSRIPLVRLIIPFIAGILSAVHMLADTVILLWTSAVILVLGGLFFRLLFAYSTKWLYGITITSFMFLCGISITEKKSGYRDMVLEAIHPEERIYLISTEGAFEARERSYRVRAKLLAARDSMGWVDEPGYCMIYAEPDSNLLDISPGSFILINAKLDTIDPPANPGEYDYKTYLARQGIFHSAYVKKGNYSPVHGDRGFNIFLYAQDLRNILLEKLPEHGISDRIFGISSALLLGEDSHLDADTRNVYAGAGAMHILCVSGLHVGVVFLVLGFLFSFLKRARIGSVVLPLILMAGIWSYALLTGLAPPVTRASCMISFFILGNTLSRHKNAYNTLAASALLMLLTDPLLIYSAGFQLSYCAVLGILSLHRPIYGLLYFKNYLPDKIWSITAVSIAAQAGTLPVVLYYFHQFPLYSLITNLIVIPLSSLIIYAGMLFFSMPSHSVAADAAAWLLSNLIHIMDAGVTLVEDIPNGLVKDIYVDLPMALMIALGIISISAYFIFKNKSFLFCTLLLGLFFSSYRTLRSYDIMKQQAFIVYSVRGHSAYDCINGNAHVFYADSLLLQSPSKIEYSIATNWLQRGLDNPLSDNSVIQMLNAQRYTLDAQRKRILVMSDLPNSNVAKKLQLDYLILSGSCRFDLADIFGIFNTELVILDASVPPWITAPEGDERFYDVREKGAFVSSECRVPISEFYWTMNFVVWHSSSAFI